MKYFIICLMAIGLTGCKAGCELEKKLSNGLASGVSTALSCTNQAAVKRSMEKFVDKLGLCSEMNDEQKKLASMEGIGSVVCSLAVNAAAGYFGDKVPAEWGCDVSGSPTKNAIAAACALIPL